MICQSRALVWTSLSFVSSKGERDGSDKYFWVAFTLAVKGDSTFHRWNCGCVCVLLLLPVQTGRRAPMHLSQKATKMKKGFDCGHSGSVAISGTEGRGLNVFPFPTHIKSAPSAPSPFFHLYSTNPTRFPHSSQYPLASNFLFQICPTPRTPTSPRPLLA